MTETGRLLVVAPHATRTGSTRVLLDLLNAARSDLPCDLAVHVESGGAWSDRFAELGPELVGGEDPVAVLANTGLAAHALVAHAGARPTVAYLHEPPAVVTRLPDDDLVGLRGADLVLCVSADVAAGAEAIGVAAERVALLPPMVTAPAIPDAAAVAAVRTELGLAAGDRLVVGCGEASWRKGTDLFLELVGHLADEPDLHLAWVGRRLRAFARLLDHDVEVLAATRRVTWMGDREDPFPILAAADLVVMTSREDPQPLAPLEAALLGTPTAALEVGGFGAMGEAGAVATVTYPDTVALAAEVRSLLADPERAGGVRDRAERWVAERQAPEVVVPTFVAHVARLLEGSAP